MDFDLVMPGLDAVRRGFALSFASVAGRRQHGLDRPVLSELAAEQCLTGPVTIPTLPSAQIGTGIAFVLDRAAGGPLAADVARAVGYLLPALVVLDSSELALVVLGCTPRPLDGAALRNAGCLLYRNGQLAATGAGGVLLDSPVRALSLVAADIGESLRAGQLVVISSITPSVPAEPGDRFAVEIAGLGSTSLELEASA